MDASRTRETDSEAPAPSCPKCGFVFRRKSRRCSACLSTERICAGCQRTFKGHQRYCITCLKKPRICEGCGKEFVGATRKCAPCWTPERACIECGRTYKGGKQRCDTCSRTSRHCIECGEEFLGTKRRCHKCQKTNRICGSCGTPYCGTNLLCWACRTSERICAICGRTYDAAAGTTCHACRRAALPADKKAEQDDRKNQDRRSRIARAEVAGPLSGRVYEAVRSSGPCVYCGAPATTTDHVHSLLAGGPELESNLVPCCSPCNASKGPKLLTEWQPARVRHGIACSPKVAAEWERLTGSVQPPDQGRVIEEPALASPYLW